MFHDIFVFVNKETRDVELVIEKDLLHTKLQLISENLKDWDWLSVDSTEDIDKIVGVNYEN